jgi:hypothetical protein
MPALYHQEEAKAMDDVSDKITHGHSLYEEQ